MNDEWIENLKAGDEVFISRGSWGLNWERRKVERITKSQIIVAGQRFNKKWNSVVGGGPWSTTYLVQVTPESKAQYREELLKRKAKDFKSRIVIPDDEDGLIKFISFARQFVPKKKEV